jgi:hypothetical protein
MPRQQKILRILLLLVLVWDFPQSRAPAVPRTISSESAPEPMDTTEKSFIDPDPNARKIQEPPPLPPEPPSEKIQDMPEFRKPEVTQSVPDPEIEEPEEAPADVATPKEKIKTKKNKKSASSGEFRVTRDECPVYRKKSMGAPVLNITEKGKKLWVEPVNKSWVKVFRKGGEVAFMSTSCLKPSAR